MVENVIAFTTLAFLLFGTIQTAFLVAGQGAVETAVHFAARTFALNARVDSRKAQENALSVASRHCILRPGASLLKPSITTVEIKETATGASPVKGNAKAGDTFFVKVRHGVELTVPMVDRIIFAFAPISKSVIGDRRILFLESTRLVEVE